MKMIDQLIDVVSPDGTLGKHWAKVEDHTEEVVQDVVESVTQAESAVVEVVAEAAHV